MGTANGQSYAKPASIGTEYESLLFYRLKGVLQLFCNTPVFYAFVAGAQEPRTISSA